ncbi:MAG: cyclopropane-fatty-acyl-phospholipid synthase family protein, partial [Pseudomonadota bacterium]
MSSHEFTGKHGPSLANPFALRDRALLAALARALRGRLEGRLTIEMPSGARRTLGDSGDHAAVSLRDFRAVFRCMRRGTIGFAEAALRGELTSPDFEGLFGFFIDNRKRLERAGQQLFRVRRRDIAFHASRENTRSGSRDNIAAHYDLGNDFYAHWLDPGMAYSSGLYLTPDATLDDAQDAKYAAVFDALALRPGQSVLEIGCGWGGFAEAAVARGARLTAITVSERQLAWTRDRLGLAQDVEPATATPDVRFCDYRDVEGTFDRIASIEMIEAVGAAHWQTYFDTIAARLAPDGTAAIQAITIREESFDNYAARPDFIQRYIFPGGMLPTRSHMRHHAAQAGLSFEVCQTFGGDYALTLRQWRDRFN